MATILYIEDTENNRILIKRRLAQNQHHVITAENAEQGLAMARSERPDLILMDMGLPGVDGWSATRRLKADPELASIPIIALTAHVMHGDREKALAAGCDDYDTKPFQFIRLLGKIDSLLASARSRREQNSQPVSPAGDPLQEAVAQAQHDLRNPLGNILGFCEILLKHVQPLGDAELLLGLNTIDQLAERMVADINHVLNPDQAPAPPAEFQALQERLREQAARVLNTIPALSAKADALHDSTLGDNLPRMAECARRLCDLIESSIPLVPTRSC
jgi:CheY-like chemotaxis protein